MRGYFVGIGLNAVNPDYYGGWDGQLNAAENDIKSLSNIADKANLLNWGYLLGAKATRANVQDCLMKLTVEARKGDFVWIAYSGHGAQYMERGKKLEGYCLRDGIFPEAEMRNLIAALPSGVKVLVTLDCCHSGGFNKSLTINKQFIFDCEADLSTHRIKAMPYDMGMTIQVEPLSKKGGRLPLNGGQYIKWLTACQKSEVALDGAKNGVFTSALLVAYRDLNEANYKVMYKTILELCAPVQHPQLKNTNEVYFSDLERFLKV